MVFIRCHLLLELEWPLRLQGPTGFLFRCFSLVQSSHIDSLDPFEPKPEPVV